MRSSAWTYVISSTQMSRTLAMNNGSVEGLKPSSRCDFRPNARQTCGRALPAMIAAQHRSLRR